MAEADRGGSAPNGRLLGPLRYASTHPTKALVILNLAQWAIAIVAGTGGILRGGSLLPGFGGEVGEYIVLAVLVSPLIALVMWLLRRIWRNPTRTVLVIYALVFGVPLILFIADGGIGAMAWWSWILTPIEVLLFILAWNEPRVVGREPEVMVRR